MHHHHHHNHHHSHHHGHDSDTSRIGWAFWLNFTFTIIEFIGGLLTNSVAIMADAVHDLGDTLSIGLAWLFGKLGHKDATGHFSYGYKRLSLMGALVNGLVLIIGSFWVLSLSIPRLFNPEMPMTEGMIALALLGIAVNGLAAYKLHGGHTMNEKILNWHLIEDVMGWVAVLIVAIVLQFVDWPHLDPILSVLFTGFILFNVARYVTQTLKLFLQGAPDKSQQQAIKQALVDIDGVTGIHDLHFWSLDGESHVLTAHLVVDSNADMQTLTEVKAEVSTRLAPFHLAHTTIEIELPSEVCRDDNQLASGPHTH